jgi:phosphate transport system substrate-binding protein
VKLALGRVAAFAVAGALVLSACGSDDNRVASSATDDAGAAAATSAADASSAMECADGTLNAEGSSAQKNAIEEAIAAYIDQCDQATINYNPTGSGAGIKQFNAGQVDFAGTDSALSESKGEIAAAQERCEGNPAWNLPLVVGPIAVAYNVEGVERLVLTPELAASIFSGKIVRWNDPKIAAANPQATLPADDIKVFFRSDESGTTENFTKYLAGAAPGAWTSEPAKSWPGAGEGREKSAGVAEGVKSPTNAITYVEWSYAKDNGLRTAEIDQGAGPVVLDGASVGRAVAAATVTGEGNDLRLELDYATKASGAYPILLVTYEVVCSQGYDEATASLVKGFLGYFASADEQASLEEIGYAPLPEELRGRVAAAVKAIG